MKPLPKRKPRQTIIKVEGVVPWGLSSGPPGLESNVECSVPPRRVNCCHYDDCLDVAVARQWPSWRCPTHCVKGEAYSREHLIADMTGLAEILAEICAPERPSTRKPYTRKVVDAEETGEEERPSQPPSSLLLRWY